MSALAEMYRSEVNIGFAVTGKRSNVLVATPGMGDEWAPDAGSVYSTVRDHAYSIFSRPYIETIHGLQLFKYLFVGAGIGFQYYCGKLHDFQMYADFAASVKGKKKASERWNALMMPIFVDIKGMYPIKEDLIPFVNLGLGGTASFCSAINFKYNQGDGYKASAKMRGGLYCDFGAGVRWKSWNFSIGLQHQTVNVVQSEQVPATEFMPKTELKTTYKVKTNAFYLKAGYCF